MRRQLRVLYTFTAIVFSGAVSPLAHAASNRVYVGLNGNNVNDCSNPATPCSTYAGAMSQLAAGGEIIVEASGGYGPISITQALSISAADGVVAYSCCQVNVNASGATVVLRGLTIDGTGRASNGINVVAVGALYVERCVITGFTGSFGGDPAHGNGIYFGSSGNLYVKDTIVRANTQVGVWIQPASGSAWASIDRSRFEGNTYGLNVAGSSFATIRYSVASGSANAGLLVESGGELNVEDCVVANNNNGIASQGTGSLARVSNSTVTDNTLGIGSFAPGPGSILSRGNNTVAGNTSNGSFTGSFLAM